MIVLGIDPGLSGGLALIESGERRRVIFGCCIPVIGVGAKRRVDVMSMLRILQRYQIGHAFIERAQAMPDQGSSSGFIYGRAVGAIEASITGMQIPVTFIEASVWKRDHGLIRQSAITEKEWRKVVKELSRARASLVFPEGSHFWARDKENHVAEGALIGDHGLSILEGKFRKSPPSPAGNRKKKPAQLDFVQLALDTK